MALDENFDKADLILYLRGKSERSIISESLAHSVNRVNGPNGKILKSFNVSRAYMWLCVSVRKNGARSEAKYIRKIPFSSRPGK